MRGIERKSRSFLGVLLLGCMSLTAMTLAAQQSGAVQGGVPASGPVPNLIKYSGVLKDASGTVLSTPSGVTFLIYKDEQGGTALWMETQNVQPDKTGHYTVQLGAVSKDGLPADVFMTGEARWLAVQIGNEAEQPRVTLVAVPYAMKAADAQTLGGLPASAFMLAPSASAAGTTPVSNSGAPASASSTNAPVTGLGTVNFLPLWDTTSDILSSVVFQSGTGATAKIGINTNAPASTLDVKGSSTVRGTLSLPATGAATTTAGKNSQAVTLAASSFNSTTKAAVAQTFQWQAEPAGNNSATPSGTLNLLFGSGANKPAETGLNIASNGQITFAKGQTFPGTGTITGVTTASSSGLTGGGTSGTLNLSLLNTCAASQVLQWNGSGWACASAGAGTITGVTAGTDLTGGGNSGSIALNLDTSKVPLLAAANTFTANQTVNGNVTATNVTATQSVSGGVVNATTGFDLGGNLFAFGSYANQNAFLGFAGNVTATGTNNTAGGYQALASNTTGNFNTAIGVATLTANGTGKGNTAIGADTLPSNTGGNYNTASGTQALGSNTTGSYNTASGDYALQGITTGHNNTGIGDFSGGTVDITFVTGSYNTSIGSGSGMSTGTLSNATTVGALAEVDASNSLVLGSINGVNNATANTLVGIGITAPNALLHIGNTGGAPASNKFVRIEGPASAGTGASAFSMGGLGDFQIDAPGVSAGRFYVREDGAVAIGTNTPIAGNRLTISKGAGPAIADNWVQYSSRRWKTNIHPLTDALGKVEHLRGVSYDLKASGKHEIGVIAEEVGEVVPEVVSYEANKKDAQGVDYSRLTALLIEAVKQQQTQLAAQQSQLREQQRLATAQQQEISAQHRQIAAEQKQISALKQRATTLESMMTKLQQERKQVELASAK
jgi:hypothetical protein